jgi:hypothetical protein
MAGFSLTVDGIEGITRKMLNTSFVIREFTKANDSTLDALQARVTTYPPVRPSSTYERTGLLKSGWQGTTREAAGIYVAESINKVVYGPYVQGTRRQARVHRGRWPTTTNILTEQRQKITGFYQAAINNIVKWLNR